MAMPEEFYKPNTKLLEAFASYVKAYRKENKLTQRQLADKCGFHYKFIQTLETQHRNISLSAFVQLANGIEIDPVKILKEILS
jgi:transcriptional regulator with XRE-family HTH domain